MSVRDEFLKTLRRQQPKPVPYYFCFCNALVEKFYLKYKHKNYRDFYDIPIREVFIKPTRLDPMEVYKKQLNGREIKGKITEWGVELEKSSVDHFFKMIGPLHTAKTAAQAAELPFPDFLADYRWEGVRENIQKLKEEDRITVTGIYGGDDTGTGEYTVAAFMDIFESAWYLRGLQEMLVDFYENPEFTQALLDRMTDFKVELAKKWAAAGIDILVTADDVGTQKGLMMSPELYRKWLKPRLKRVIAAAREINPDILIFYHSCGDIAQIIPDLIDAGVEILNPLQPECMNPAQIMTQYGSELSFWGAVGTQSTMPFGTPQDVRDKCMELLEAAENTGGLVLAPTHLLESEVPIENVDALVCAAAEYNGTETVRKIKEINNE